MKKRLPIMIIIALLLTVLLSGCAPGDVRFNERPANFLAGIWHGWIAPFTLIISLFNSKVSMFEVNNTGWWYSFGFYIAIVGGFGGFAFFRRKKRD